MSIEFTHVPTFRNNKTGAQAGFLDSPDGLRGLGILEQASFSSVILDGPGGIFANIDIAAEAARRTSTLTLAVTHWPGVIEPAFAAQQFAELDRLAYGRLALRCLPSCAASGDTSPAGHEASWHQLDEYLVLLKRLWSNSRPFDHEGSFYSVRDGYVRRKGPSGMDIPLRLNGVSGTAIKVAGRHADVFELAALEQAELRGLIERVTKAASRHGRANRLRFALPVSIDLDPSAPEDVRVDENGRAVSISGGPDAISSALRDLAGIGIDEFMVSGLSGPLAIANFTRWIVPHVRRRERVDVVGPRIHIRRVVRQVG